MPNFTPRLNLTKPLTSENYDVGVPNGNADLVDGAPANVTICTSVTRPSTPDEGDVIIETDSTNVLVRQGGAWKSFNAKVHICTSGTRPASTLTFGGFRILETDTGNSLIRNAANTSWISLAPYSVANTTERNALTGVYEGMIVYRRDIDVHEALTNDLVTWYGIAGKGMRRNIAARIVTTAGVINSGIAGTETNIGKMAMDNEVIQAGQFIIWMRLTAQFSAAANSFTIKVRKDTPLTGSVIADFTVLSQVSGFTQDVYGEQPWKAGSADADFDAYVSVVRNAGAGTMDVNGGNKAAWGIDEYMAPASFLEVP